ncbi:MULTISPECIES: SIS domain-containing protein [Hafnia]|uniref:MurPQ operon repressor n=2 Tax=Hafnia alvei TaxID=569 RepID=A0A377PMK3_HAFAL|nr:SIS domain-containing protein [Hafnia alvei]KFC86156.1 RpiR family transcriptional regulator [Hafnia alvei ATCC 13337]MCV9378980.1 SIS domain-containing protein [Hafnia alvei]MDX6844890.1 SIS domain-containing protein [Hafnia alvei]RLR09615.1 SIS domain-containing protein [Hafnia alvei ATCC 13337]TBM31606.1 SIS domain-containing protein [Hafnia alvei]
MRCLQRITLNKDAFTPGERIIADYILANPDKLKQCSSQELASILNISQSSIVKFAQRLGFKGFTNLKMALIEEWGQQSKQSAESEQHLHNDINVHDTPSVIAEKLFRAKQQALRMTTDSVNLAQLESTVAEIKAARRVQIMGMGGSSLVAKDLAYKLMKIGYPVMNEMDSHVQMTVAQSLGEGDVQIVISYSGALKEIVIAAQAAQEKGAKIIAITSLQDSPLRKLADFVLDTIADEARWRSSSISARTAQNTITDLLFVCLLQEDSERSRSFIHRSQEMIEQLK